MSEKVNEELKGKKRPGRKAMTPDEKEAVSKARAVKKKQADRMKPEIILQFHGTDISMDDLAVDVIAAKGLCFRQLFLQRLDVVLVQHTAETAGVQVEVLLALSHCVAAPVVAQGGRPTQ